MTYPTLTFTQCEALAAKILEGEDVDVEADASWVGAGDPIDLAAVAATADEAASAIGIWTGADRDQLEGKHSPPLFHALAGTPQVALDDPGFWRYLAVRYYFPFIQWREEKPFEDGKHMVYLGAENSRESVLTRMYLRAQAVGEGYEELAGELEKATDFWRSHVLRVQTGMAPPITRAFVEAQSTERLTTNPLRKVARVLNRTWTNTVLHLYDDAEAETLIREVWTIASASDD